MKFTSGYWLIKEGVQAHFAACAAETEQQAGEYNTGELVV
jgi:hypothetical protein